MSHPPAGPSPDGPPPGPKATNRPSLTQPNGDDGMNPQPKPKPQTAASS